MRRLSCWRAALAGLARVTHVFDRERDGYDGEDETARLAMKGRTRPPRSLGSDAHACPECGSETLLPGIVVTYQGDDDDFLEGWPAGVHPADVFDGIGIAAECARCLVASEVTGVECA